MWALGKVRARIERETQTGNRTVTMQNCRQIKSNTIDSCTFNIPDIVQRLQRLQWRFLGVCWRSVPTLGVYNYKYRRVFWAVGVGGFGDGFVLCAGVGKAKRQGAV